MRTGIISAMINYGDRGCRIMASDRVRKFIESGAIGDWEPAPILRLMAAVAKTDDARLIEASFIDALSTLNEKARVTMLEAAEEGADIGRITSKDVIRVGKGMGGVPQPRLKMMIMIATRQQPSGIRPRA